MELQNKKVAWVVDIEEIVHLVNKLTANNVGAHVAGNSLADEADKAAVQTAVVELYDFQ